LAIGQKGEQNKFMQRVLKWIAVAVSSLIGLFLVTLLTIYFITEAQINKTYSLPVETIAIPADPASIERGRHLVETVGFCADCHAQNLAGQVFDDGLFIGRLSVPNLTSGAGGIKPSFVDTDWVRAIRHGVDPEGKPLLDMPSNFYYNYSDADLGAMIAYLKSLPPVDNEQPDIYIGPMARLFILQDPSLIPAQVIDHAGPRPPAPEPGVTVEYGRYLALVCQFCHGEDLSGSAEPGAGLNLTPAGNLGNWSEADFIHAIRTGVTPEGRQLDPTLMPWDRLAQLSDEELKAIWLYLQSLPPVETEKL
jgi:mono/diheme cytochrome c family protein